MNNTRMNNAKRVIGGKFGLSPRNDDHNFALLIANFAFYIVSSVILRDTYTQ